MADFLTPKQYAEATGIPLSAVWRWLREGKLVHLPRSRHARIYRIPRTALEAVASNEEQSQTKVLTFSTERRG